MYVSQQGHTCVCVDRWSPDPPKNNSQSQHVFHYAEWPCWPQLLSTNHSACCIYRSTNICKQTLQRRHQILNIHHILSTKQRMVLIWIFRKDVLWYTTYPLTGAVLIFTVDFSSRVIRSSSFLLPIHVCFSMRHDAFVAFLTWINHKTR